MAFSGRLYSHFPEHLARKRIDLTTDTIKLSLHTAAYVPDQDNHEWQSQLTNELVAGNGYTAGGFTLASKTLTLDAATNTVVFDAADISQANTTLTWRVAVIYDATPGSAATNPLIGYFVSDTDIISTGGTTTITFAANGIARISVA